MTKSAFSEGFNRSLEFVDQIYYQEVGQLDAEMKQKFPELENFCKNFGSLCFAKGFELVKTDQEIEKLRKELG